MIRSVIIFLLLAGSFSALSQAREQTVDFNDCGVLTEKTHSTEYRQIVAQKDRLAASGDVRAQQFMAGLASRKFACMIESASSGRAGWHGSSGENGSNHVIRRSTTVLADDLLRKNPPIVAALHDAFDRFQILANVYSMYRSMAAEYVADYPAFFHSADYARAYRYAVGVREVECNRPDAEKEISAPHCATARVQTAALYPELNGAQRDEAERQGRDWAARYAQQHSGNQW